MCTPSTDKLNCNPLVREMQPDGALFTLIQPACIRFKQSLLRSGSAHLAVDDLPLLLIREHDLTHGEVAPPMQIVIWLVRMRRAQNCFMRLEEVE